MEVTVNGSRIDGIENIDINIGRNEDDKETHSYNRKYKTSMNGVLNFGNAKRAVHKLSLAILLARTHPYKKQYPQGRENKRDKFKSR